MEYCHPSPPPPQKFVLVEICPVMVEICGLTKALMEESQPQIHEPFEFSINWFISGERLL